MNRKIVLSADAEGYGGEVDLAANTFTMRAPDGRLVTMDLGQADVHIDRALSNFATGYSNAMMGADLVMPIVPVTKASDYYFEFSPDDALATVDGTQVNGGTNVPEVSPSLSNTRYQTLGYALGSFIPTEVIQNQDAPLNIEMKSTRVVMDRLMLNREVRCKTVMFNKTRYTGAHLLDYSATPTKKWNGGSASDPVKDIQTLRNAALMPITDMFMDRLTWDAFVTNANVQKYTAYKSSAPPLPTFDQRAMFAALLDLPMPHVIESRAKDSTGAYPYVWAGSVVLIHRPKIDIPVDGFDIASAKTFRWVGIDENLPPGVPPLQQVGTKNGITVRSFFNPYRGKKGGTQIIVTHDDAEQFITDKVSGLIFAAYQP